jgi:S-DNA-T family DNA segregation ATPase FtsK/SpoIIIE
MPDNSPSSTVNEEDILAHHPSDADFYNEELEIEVPVRRKRAASSATRKRVSRSSSPSKGRTSKSIQRVPAGPWRYEITGLLLAAFSGILLFNALRPSAEGILPRLGVGALRWLFGAGTSLILLMILIAGVSLMWRRHHFYCKRYIKICCTALLILLTAIHLYIPKGQEFVPNALFCGGGAVGASLAWILRRGLGEGGAFAAIVVASIIAAFQLCQISFAEAATKLGSGVRNGASRLPRHHLDQVKSTFTAPFFKDTGEEEITPWDGDKSTFTKPRRSPFLPREKSEDAAPASPFLPINELLDQAEETPPAMDVAAPAAEAIVPESVPVKPVVTEIPQEPEEDPLTPQEALAAQADASATKTETPSHQPRPLRLRKRVGDGPPLPSYFDNAVNALDPPIATKITDSQEDIAKGVQQVEETLAAFRIDAHVTDVKKGPVITRYEVQPAAGVRVASIANLDRDLARSLSAIAVRIEAPVPGRNVVGIEVPNKKVQLVRLRDVLDLPEFLSAPSKLSFVLGKDIAGQAKWADLAKMPHLLIAGATNSGKSVCLNSIIASIISRAEPDEVKFSLIDPKRVELTLYRDIPHLYHPVVVEPREAVRALRGGIVEMERRYKLFAERGVRNIASYNKKLREDDERLPYIVIVIDELADLMMTAAAEFEKLICRLAQLARATGIHLIVATQRPSVNVITGVIKANIPARIAFAVASQVDSRTILDSVGAERLIGSGDMLFDANNGGKSTRIQGAFLSEEEVNRVVEEVKNYYADSDETYEYGLDLTLVDDGPDESSSSSSNDEKRDSLYDEIKEFVLRYDDMSASLIQRKFEIGYPRAGRIVDQLERDGILGPADGPKPRKVLGGGGESA